MQAKGFAIHWWGDPAQKPTFTGILNVLLQRGIEKSASVNFLAEAGKVACLVSPTRVAWGQGDGGTGWGNLNLVSIECNPRCTVADRETVAELMADQHILNGIPLVAYPHNKFTATQCPGVWEQHIPMLVSRAKQIVAARQNPTKESTPVAKASPDTEYLKDLAYDGWKDSDGKKHPGFMLTIEETQRRVDLILAHLGIKK